MAAKAQQVWIFFSSSLSIHSELADKYDEKIVNEYLLPSSEKEINIDDDLVTAVKAKMKTPDEKLFDAAQHWIFTLMWQDSWPKFVKTDTYKQAGIISLLFWLLSVED